MTDAFRILSSPLVGGDDALFPMLSILDIRLLSTSFFQQILANCLPFITVPAASRCCVPSEKKISPRKLHMAFQ